MFGGHGLMQSLIICTARVLRGTYAIELCRVPGVRFSSVCQHSLAWLSSSRRWDPPLTSTAADADAVAADAIATDAVATDPVAVAIMLQTLS